MYTFSTQAKAITHREVKYDWFAGGAMVGIPLGVALCFPKWLLADNKANQFTNLDFRWRVIGAEIF